MLIIIERKRGPGGVRRKGLALTLVGRRQHGGRFYFIFLFYFYFSLSVCVGCSNNGVIKSKELDCLSRKQSSCSLFKG